MFQICNHGETMQQLAPNKGLETLTLGLRVPDCYWNDT